MGISRIIKDLKNNTACGQDRITTNDIKILKDIICEPLSRLINGCIERGEFPTCLKIAKIIPIHKSGNKNEPGNYRPISLLSPFSKIFEKILHSRFVMFINKNGGFDPYQYGFQKGSNTTSTLIDAMDHINREMDEGKYVVPIFIDMSKAFDTVNHAKLLSKLYGMGFRGKASNLIESYLRDRMSFTVNFDSKSEKVPLNIGVPQGSVLGPLLYLLYIDNLRYYNLTGKYFIYADDTLLVYSGKRENELQNSINQDLGKFVGWLDENSLTINTNKTKYMIFKQKNKPCINLSLQIKNEKIERAITVKYLGLNIDEKLVWTNHIDSVRKKLGPIVGIMRRTDLFDDKTKKNIYNAFIVPRICYGLTVWSQCSLQMKGIIQRIMNKALKITFNLDRYTRTLDVYNITNRFNLDKLIFAEKTKIMFKVANKFTKSNIKL
jgi:hypothetical protein